MQKRLYRIIHLARSLGGGNLLLLQLLIMLLSFKLGIGKTWRLTTRHDDVTHTWYINNRGDIAALEDVFLSKEYEVSDLNPKIIFDLGANIGAASVYFALRYPKAEIYAFEPQPKVFEKLIRNTHKIPRIHPLRAAVGETNGEIDFYIGINHLSSSTTEHISTNEKITVRSLTLASAMSETGVKHIDLLKYDIEGAEEQIFADQDFEQNFSNAIGEVHLDLIKSSREEFVDKFKNYQTKIMPINDYQFILLAKQLTKPQGTENTEVD